MTRALTIAASVLLAAQVHAAPQAETMPVVENFALIDHEGKFRELDYYCRLPQAKGLVLFVQGNGCPLVRKRLPELNRMKAKYERQGILFSMLNANPQDERADIAEEAKEFGIEMPILKDDAQLVASMLGVKRTAEVYLIDTETKAVRYRGAIDDRMSYQSERPKAEKHYLRDAMDAMLGGKEIATPITDAPGCKVAMPKSEPSYAKDIAPLLKARCVRCHTKGGLGTFPMSSYKKVRGWSEMIAEVVMTKQMPPWHADPEIGEFENDCALEPEEAFSLVSWVRAGCPRGDGTDPLEGYRLEVPDWHLGEPDYAVTIPEQKVAAEGVFDYRYETLDNPFDHDVWLTATEVRPGNTRVLHHVIVTAHEAGDRKREQWITGYAPGAFGKAYPEGSAVHLRKGWKLRFQLHYTASGKVETDATQLGLHFSKQPISKQFRTLVIAQHKFRIPPGVLEHPAEKVINVKNAAKIYAINPHMHYRGKRMSFDLRHPDGEIEPLLSVPNYNFNWQRTYMFDKPVSVPAGSRIIVRNAWDNSELNPYNPDPKRAVTWGDQSFEEMFFATIGYIED
jgi:hypothetical protein